MKNILIRCSKISVDCVSNDPVDIRCGGPEFLGFDFYVREENTKEMTKFIIMTLDNLEVPFVSIKVTGTAEVKEEDVWTKKRVVKAIHDNAEYLQHEAKRNHSSSNKNFNL